MLWQHFSAIASLRDRWDGVCWRIQSTFQTRLGRRWPGRHCWVSVSLTDLKLVWLGPDLNGPTRKLSCQLELINQIHNTLMCFKIPNTCIVHALSYPAWIGSTYIYLLCMWRVVSIKIHVMYLSVTISKSLKVLIYHRPLWLANII